MKKEESTVNWERVRLGSSHAVSETTVHGWPSVWFGVPFAGAGAAVFLIYLGVIQVDPKTVHAPMWVLGLVGALFFLAGAFLTGHGFRGLRLKARVEEGKRRYPDQPWMWDYRWDPRGASENKMKMVVQHFLAAIVFVAFLAPFHYVVWFNPESHPPMWVKGVVLFFDFIVLLIIGDAFRKWFQYLKYGNSRLRFQSFPFYAGGTMRLALEGIPETFDRMTLSLRYVEEGYEIRGTTHRNRRRDVVCYQVYSEERTLHSAPARGGRLVMEWKLPGNKEMVNELSARPARFWVLDAKAETPGVDYESRFLVPVYAKSGAVPCKPHSSVNA